MEKQTKKEKMLSAPVRALILCQAGPTIAAMLVSASYNTADTFFVGRVDDAATAAVSAAFSAMTLLQAVGYCLGQGSGIYISEKLGRGEEEKAAAMASFAFYAAVAFGVLAAAGGLLGADALAGLLGAADSFRPETAAYLRWLLLGAPFILGSFVLSNQLRFQGASFGAMLGISAGAVLNVALDWLFVWRFGWGAGGAGAATAAGQAVAFLLLLFIVFKNGSLRPALKQAKPQKAYVLAVTKSGFPSFARQGVITAAGIAQNFAVRPFGEAAVAGIGVFSRVTFVLIACVIGFGQGFQPVCGFNWGAGKRERVRRGYWFCVWVTTAFLAAGSVLLYLFAPQVASFFRASDEVIAPAVQAIRLQCVVFASFGYACVSNMLLQSLGQTGRATFLALCRQGVFYIPLLFLLPRFLGFTGIALAQPAADVLTFLATLLLAPPTVRRLKEKGAENT